MGDVIGVPAHIKWLTPHSQTWAKKVERLSAPSRFDTPDGWTVELWSLVVYTPGEPDANGEQDVTVLFLSAQAPNAWLVPGRHFQMMDVSVPFAEGTIEKEYK